MNPMAVVCRLMNIFSITLPQTTTGLKAWAGDTVWANHGNNPIVGT